MIAPTPRQLEIHAAMLAFQRAHGMPPTVRELGRILGIASTNGVTDHLIYLAKKGLVRHRPGIARAWIAIETQPQEGITP